MKITIYYIFFSALFLACNDLKFDNEYSLPIIEMREVSEIDKTGVTLKAFVNHIGSKNIIRGFFNWYPKGKKIVTEEKRFMIDVEVKNRTELNVRIDRDLIASIEYEARFVIELEDEKVYSPSVTFLSEGALSEPIKIKNSFHIPIGNSGSVTRQGLGKIFYNDNSRTLENSQILLYEEKNDAWELRTIKMGGHFVSSIFKGTNDLLLGYGSPNNHSSHPTFYIWKTDDFNSEIQELGEFNYFELKHSVNFLLNDIYYGNTSDWQLSSFDINNYDGVEVFNTLPFPNDAVKYYSFEVDNKGYVFFSNKKTSTDGSNQLWEFNPSTFEWSKLNSFPGTGKDYFSVSTDNHRYIYIGMGFGRNFIGGVVEGDIWRFDVIDNNWELIGWIPTPSTFETSTYLIEDSRVIDDVNYLIMRSRKYGTRVFSIRGDEIRPL